MDETLEKAETLNHEIINGYYDSKNSEIVVRCNTHGYVNKTKFNNYLRSPNGLKCCGVVSKSLKLTNRKYSDDTIEKMKNSANSRLRSKTAFSPKDWRRCTEYSTWERNAINLWNKNPKNKTTAPLLYNQN